MQLAHQKCKANELEGEKATYIPWGIARALAYNLAYCSIIDSRLLLNAGLLNPLKDQVLGTW